IAVFAILVVLTCTACPPNCPPPPDNTRERVVLIFSDVTSSLVESESEQVATLTSSVVDSLPPATRYFIYPVQVEGQKLEPLDEGRIVVQDADAAEGMKMVRKDKLKHKIAELYNLIKSVKQPPDSRGKPDNHTCILDTLEFAQNRFKEFDQKKTDFELVYVS